MTPFSPSELLALPDSALSASDRLARAAALAELRKEWFGNHGPPEVPYVGRAAEARRLRVQRRVARERAAA